MGRAHIGKEAFCAEETRRPCRTWLAHIFTASGRGKPGNTALLPMVVYCLHHRRSLESNADLQMTHKQMTGGNEVPTAAGNLGAGR